MNATVALPVVGIDVANAVFQLAVADGAWRVIEEHRLTRTQFERWFANRAVGLVVMEASHPPSQSSSRDSRRRRHVGETSKCARRVGVEVDPRYSPTAYSGLVEGDKSCIEPRPKFISIGTVFAGRVSRLAPECTESLAQWGMSWQREGRFASMARPVVGNADSVEALGSGLV